MTSFSVELFKFLQGADFYRQIHLAAAQLLTRGDGRTWLDVGCGPGLLTRIAAERGYRAHGIDRSAGMIMAAKALAQVNDSSASFDCSDIDAVVTSEQQYDVVSASSLIVVTSEPAKTLREVERLVKPGGAVLIIEASSLLTRSHALRLLLNGALGRRGFMLVLWAMARGGRTLNEAFFERPDRPVSRHRLLHGLVDAWVMEVRT